MIGIKICGVCRPQDAALAARAGATHVGVILDAPGPRRRTGADAARIYAAAEGLRRVGVFADAPPDAVTELADRLGLDVVQLHGAEPPDAVAAVAAAGPWRVWKAVRPLSAASLAGARAEWLGHIEALLVDGSAPGALGGTGVRAPWDVLAPARWQGAPGLVLAGGLSAANVAEAVARLAPDVVDVSSGVEVAPGEKDEAAMVAFVRAAREAVRAIARSQESKTK